MESAEILEKNFCLVMIMFRHGRTQKQNQKTGTFLKGELHSPKYTSTQCSSHLQANGDWPVCLEHESALDLINLSGRFFYQIIHREKSCHIRVKNLHI